MASPPIGGHPVQPQIGRPSAVSDNVCGNRQGNRWRFANPRRQLPRGGESGAYLEPLGPGRWAWPAGARAGMAAPECGWDTHRILVGKKGADHVEQVRSWLFAPATFPDRCRKAYRSVADQVIWDLEDAVPMDQKEKAREQAVALLRETENGPRRPWVRINSPKEALGQADLAALAPWIGRHCGLVVPKADLATVRWLQAQQIAGPWLLLVESARAVWDLRVEDWSRVTTQSIRLAFGSLDYQQDLGLRSGPDEADLLPARIEVVTASRVWGLPAPIDGIYGQIHDAVGLAAFAQRSHRQGFAGMLAIHPAQLEGIHRAFAPTPEEVAWAQRVLAVWQDEQGAMTVDGLMVDRPVIERARRILHAGGSWA